MRQRQRREWRPSAARHLVWSAPQSFTYGVEQPATDQQGDDRTMLQDIDDMRLAGGQVNEAIERFQLLEDKLDLPARRVGLSDGVGVERIQVDFGQGEPILGAVGEPDRDQPQTTANGASGAGVDAMLERHLDFDIEHVSLQSAVGAGGRTVAPKALRGRRHIREYQKVWGLRGGGVFWVAIGLGASEVRIR